jgi:hypothetical protein
MKRTSAVFTAVAAVMGFLAPSARAEISAEAARASVAPFYKALNAEFASESPELIKQSTAPQWLSCRGNDICVSRDQVIAGMGQRLKSVPADQGNPGLGQSGHRARRSNRHAGGRIHGRGPYR